MNVNFAVTLNLYCLAAVVGCRWADKRHIVKLAFIGWFCISFSINKIKKRKISIRFFCLVFFSFFFIFFFFAPVLCILNFVVLFYENIMISMWCFNWNFKFNYAIRIDWIIWNIAEPHTTNKNNAKSQGPTGYWSSLFFCKK